MRKVYKFKGVNLTRTSGRVVHCEFESWWSKKMSFSFWLGIFCSHRFENEKQRKESRMSKRVKHENLPFACLVKSIVAFEIVNSAAALTNIIFINLLISSSLSWQVVCVYALLYGHPQKKIAIFYVSPQTTTTIYDNG